MSLPAVVSHTGSISGSPAQSSAIAPSLQELLNTSFSATYSARASGGPTIIGATDLAPFVLPLVTITKVRIGAFRVRGGSLKFVITSPVAPDQEFRISDLWMFHVPNPGDELTVIKIVGTADLEYVIAGDVS